jgi:uncharacterized protein (TIGR00290 family)
MIDREKEKVTVSWSGGKDCTLAMHKIMQSGQFEVVSLHTTFNEDTKRVGLHGIKQSLIEQQAKSIGISLHKIFIPTAQNHDAYEKAIHQYYESLSAVGIKKIVFGDIFLEDLKRYREKMLLRHGLEGIFPLWKLNSKAVAKDFIHSGYKAAICAADAKYFRETDVGRDYDLDFINSLHSEVDPCGENGEFHSFVYDGPVFKKPIAIQRQQIEAKEYSFKVRLPNGGEEERVSKFWFQELV